MGLVTRGGCVSLAFVMLVGMLVLLSPHVFAVTDATPLPTQPPASRANASTSVNMAVVLEALLFGSGGFGEKDIALSMARSVADGYTAGSSLDISVTVNATGAGAAVTALGLVETVPAGWGFEFVQSSPPAAVAPVAGSSGVLEFAWITIPAFPFTFTYRLAVPQGETGVKQIAGRLKYRTSGGELTTDPLTTNIPPFGAPASGGVLVSIAPDYAIDAGATWRVDGGDWHTSGETVDNLAVGQHVVSFSDIPSQDSGGCFHANVEYQTPPDQQVEVVANQTSTVIATYERAPKTLVAKTSFHGRHGDSLLFGSIAVTLSVLPGARRKTAR